ncbi:MAG: lipopolysaccharide kinase InaA family protein, partial [Rhodanobacteraceae bacterium]
IEGVHTLAEALQDRRLDAKLAARVGELIALFHAANVYHADLNAHNILIGPKQLWLVDFDRGSIRGIGGEWRPRNLGRLRRSLLKLGACNGDEERYERMIWMPLMRGYEATVRT